VWIFVAFDGLRVLSGALAYGTSKAATHHLTATLDVEWIKYGINANAAAPTNFDTPMNKEKIEPLCSYVRKRPICTWERFLISTVDQRQLVDGRTSPDKDSNE
jgi:NAD(P)-dependent dehydrogenase (short-subunit alcohol dehydrogenase family)